MNHNGNNIESRLWDAADELRANSKLKSSEYSVPVLGLVFLRYADHKFQAAAMELSGAGSGRRKIGPADYQAKGVLYVPEAARFSALITLPDGANIDAAIDEANAAKPDGMFPFFTCSQETFRTDTWSFDGEYVLLASNNAAGIYPLKYFNGKFDAYQRTYAINTIDENVLVTRYVYYALRLQLELMKNISTGVATKFLTLSLLNRTQIPVPPLPTQRKIAAILSAYDDLIENNLRRIKILEEMAQNLYREWFVKFRFPGHQHARFIDSPLGRIPEGWDVVKN